MIRGTNKCQIFLEYRFAKPEIYELYNLQIHELQDSMCMFE